MQILINNGNLDVYGFSFPLIQKHQMSHIKLDVVGPEVIKVEEGSDVTLPCSLLPEEDITSKEFIWKKMSKNDESEMEVFLYDNGDLYSDERPGQSEQFKGRVSHSPDKLKQGNASITIRNMTMADSGEYMCIIQSVQKPKIFHIKLVVEPKVITVEEGSDVTLPCSLSTKNLLSTWFVWKKTDDGRMVCLYNKGDLYSGKGAGQSEQFKGRVSHFEDELKQGNASIIIRNTTRADSGVYICIIQSIQKPEAFYIKLVVDQLEQGNASITIRNTTRTDSGE
ncbi:hypothetical protein PFLUV_G00051250 [Perca fluviatilis]|uniref:Ig-like domain-containing protein n=2 Tax=Perca fluviatilis TaxID=8168 RepID=A0A6A5FJ97_PERFL|nr:hypothetical protein PFLUV_G00051250 [Perca fluviatilis]